MPSFNVPNDAHEALLTQSSDSFCIFYLSKDIRNARYNAAKYRNTMIKFDIFLHGRISQFEL